MARRAMNPRSLENLEKGRGNRFTGETAGKAGRMGAKSDKRAEKLRLRYCLEYLLRKKSKIELPDGEEITMTGAEQIAAALFEKALSGDVRAFEIIRDTVGEKPVDRVQFEEIDAEIITEVEKAVKEAAAENIA